MTDEKNHSTSAEANAAGNAQAGADTGMPDLPVITSITWTPTNRAGNTSAADAADAANAANADGSASSAAALHGAEHHAATSAQDAYEIKTAAHTHANTDVNVAAQASSASAVTNPADAPSLNPHNATSSLTFKPTSPREPHVNVDISLNSPRDSKDSQFTDAALSNDIDETLGELDPLTLRPRTSATVLCAVFCVVFAAIAACAYWLGVRTVDGQSYEDEVITAYAGHMPGFLSEQNTFFGKSAFVISMGLIMCVIALIVSIVRKRWELIVQLVVLVAGAVGLAQLLQPILPRPYLVNIASSIQNSAPSGHTIFIAASSLALICAVPRAWRAAVSIITAILTAGVGFSVIIDQWHRTSDVVMAIFLAGAIAMFVLMFTRKTGMDAAGKRASSPSVQIVSSVFITAGLLGFLYSSYLLWQIQPGLQFSATWTISGAMMSTTTLVSSSVLLVFGMVLMMRQLTASPLTRIGLLGAPPTPPRD